MSPAGTLHDLNDPALWAVIDAGGEPAREAAIEAVLTKRVAPQIAAIVKRFRRMEPNFQVEDMEELSSLIVLRFIRKVRAAAVDEEHAIKTLENYVTRLAYNALYDFRRDRYPERHRLKRNLRYLLTRSSELALWEWGEEWAAGLSKWQGQPSRPAPEELTRFTAAPRMCDQDRPAEAVHSILQRIGHPVSFESLVDLVAELWNIRDAVVESGEFPADERQDPLGSIEQREQMQTLWREIRQLPANQRTALLLNLRDSTGSNALTLFLLLEVASAEDIAGALEVSVEELNRIWADLPLEDALIAGRLGLTRQQVINLRKSARLRLSRRMSRWT